MLRRLLEVTEGPAGMVPAGQAAYAIGDVHGRLDLLEDLLGASSRMRAGIRPITYAAWCFWRLCRSRFGEQGVVERLLDDPMPGFSKVYLMGTMRKRCWPSWRG